MRIAVDLDNVTVGFAELVARLHGFTIADCAEWNDLIARTGRSKRKFWQWVRGEGIFARLPEVAGAVLGVETLRGRHHVDFVTHRPEWARADTVAWLAARFEWFTEDRLILADDKVSTGHDVYVDDAPHVLERAVDAGRVAVRFACPWNEHAPCTVTARNWQEVIDHVG